MKALVYHGPGSKAWEDVPDPTIAEATDVIVRIDTTWAPPRRLSSEVEV
jgi:alcohol dehydrogenase